MTLHATAEKPHPGQTRCNSAAPHEPQHLRQGAIPSSDGAVTWRIWTPLHERMTLVLLDDHAQHGGQQRREVAMQREPLGYFTHREQGVRSGQRYAYKLPGGEERPDPASRWQPDGVHRPSAVLRTDEFTWSDDDWRGIDTGELVIYELHIGTFTAEGTFDAAIGRLEQLKELGVTAIEIMPVAQFPGSRNWGYDGVYLSAAQSSYGGPAGLQRLVDAAHRAGLAVLLDVVYNHFGPEGNYLGEFGHYFTSEYRTPWGLAVNYDGPHSDAVRQFVIDSACGWVRDFHIDGLRLDAIHAIYDMGPKHLLADLQEQVQSAARQLNRRVLVIGETSSNDMRLVNPPERGGYGLDAIWTDDFHHSLHALLTGERDGYYMEYGRPEQLAQSFNQVFVYDGCYSPYRRRRHGTRAGEAARDQFVICIQNHDQTGNRALGERYGSLLSPAAQRLAAGLLLIHPCVPLLFMGEEYGETRPFPFFCSFGDPALIEAVRNGRREEFAGLQFEWGTEIPDPHSEHTFASAVLSWQWLEGSPHGGMRRLYRDLLSARRRWPELRDREHASAEVLGPATNRENSAPNVVLRVQRGAEPGLIAYANLTDRPQAVVDDALGQRVLLLSSEDARYGGARTPHTDARHLLPHELALWGEARDAAHTGQPNQP